MNTLALILAFYFSVQSDFEKKSLKEEDIFRHENLSLALNMMTELYNSIQSKNFVLFDVIEAKPPIKTLNNYSFVVVFAPTTCSKDNLVTLANMRECKILGYGFQKCSFTSRTFPLSSGYKLGDLLLKVCTSTKPRIPDKPQLLGFEIPNDASKLFKEFKYNHGKQYTNEEDLYRFEVFKTNLLRSQLYQVLDQGSAIYGVTPFSDLTPNEFAKTYLNTKLKYYKPRGKLVSPNQFTTLPDSFDWRIKGAVTDVKNQKACGSCWAFSVTGNIEAQWFRKSGNLVSLSEQQLVDCDNLDDGCGGGLPSNAYESIIKMGGLMSETNYPYDARNEKCHLKNNNFSAYINNSISLPEDEKLLALWLTENSTISVGMNAMLLQFYVGGVSHPWGILCSKRFLDHAVLLVGFGNEGSTPFWIVKNSWGREWGESGYFRLYRGDGTCGINTIATSAVIY